MISPINKSSTFLRGIKPRRNNNCYTFLSTQQAKRYFGKMLEKTNNFKDQNGITLFLAILVLSAILAISFSIATILFVEIRSSGDLVRTEGVFYGAEAISEEVFFKTKRNIGGTFVYSNKLGQVSVDTPVESDTAPLIYETVVTTSNCTFLTAEHFPIYNPDHPTEGSGFKKIKIENTGDSSLQAWVCQYNPSGLTDLGQPYATTVCANQDSNEYWTNTYGNVIGSGMNSKYQAVNGHSSVEWNLDTSLQQELVLTNYYPCSAPLLIRIIGYGSDGVTQKALPLIGETSVTVKADTGGVSRRLELRIPDSSSAGGTSSPSPSATHFSVSAPSSSIQGAQFSNLVVTALDSGNNTVTGYTGTVHFTSTDSLATLPANSTLTNGMGTFSATLYTAGSQTITATDMGNSSVVGISGSIAVSSGMNGFAHRRAITVQGSKISQVNQTTLSNFPVLVCFNGSGSCNSSLTPSFSSSVQNSNGYDIVFTTDSACSSNLNWEVEKYNSSTGELEAWIKTPPSSLSYNTDYTFYMCYGKSGISSFQGGATGSVWDTNYKGVFHFGDGTTLSLRNSIGSNHGTNHGSVAVAGPSGLGGAAGFGGGWPTSYEQYISTPVDDRGAAWTREFWLYAGDNNYTGIMAGMGGPGGCSAGYNFNRRTTNRVELQRDCEVGSDFGSTGLISSSAWQHLVFTRTGDNAVDGFALYINGSLIGTAHTWGGSGADGGIAFGSSGGYAIEGSLDEVRLSNIVRSADWIKTEYNNQNLPSTFYNIGAEQ
jgi:hypothetical protein